MPTCPGCRQSVSYDRLDTHERYCSGLRGDAKSRRGDVQHLEERLDEIERQVEGRLQTLEMRIGSRSLPGADDDNHHTLLEGDW